MSLALIVGFIAPAWPAAADEQTQQRQAAPSEWSVVRALKPGTEIVLASTGSQRTRVYLLRASDLGLTILNVSDPAIPASAKRALANSANKPDRFLPPQQGGELILGKDVRLTANGVFVDDHKVAELGQVIEDVPRNDVVQISALRKHVGRHIGRGALIGAAIGASIGAAGAKGEYGAGELAVAGAIVGAVYGTGIGALVGAASGRTPEVIYRAPAAIQAKAMR